MQVDNLNQRSVKAVQGGSSWLLTRAAWQFTIGGVLIVVAIGVILSFLPQRKFGSDFSLAYLPGRLLSEHRDPYASSLPQYNSEQALPFLEIPNQATNPPLLLWLFQWLSIFPPTTAFWLWTTVEILSLVVIAMTARQLIGKRLSPSAWVLAGGLTLCSFPMFTHFWFSQKQLPVTALIMLGVVFQQKQRPYAASTLVTIAAVLKLYAWPILAMPALGLSGQFRTRRLVIIAGLLILWALIPGWHLWVSFFQHALPFLAELGRGDYYNFTITSFLGAVIHNPAGRWLGTGLSVLIVGMTWYRCDGAIRRNPCAFESSVCLLLVCTVMCSAIAWTHYLVILIYPLLCLATDVSESKGLRRLPTAGLLVASILVFNMGGSNPFTGWPQPIRTVSAYGPLFMMAILYVYFTRRLRHQSGIALGR